MGSRSTRSVSPQAATHRFAWFVASLATIGGALGSALESEDAVRAAAYSSSAAERDDAAETAT